MSILSHLSKQPWHSSSVPETIRLLYSTRFLNHKSTASAPKDRHQEDINSILFFPRLHRIFQNWNILGFGERKFELFLTSPLPSTSDEERSSLGPGLELRRGRITREDLRNALGPADEREATVVYVCGPQDMTDEMVAFLEEDEGMKGRVLAEKWW